MVAYHELFEINTANRPSFNDVTDRVKETISRSGVRDGIAVVYSQHTTCSVIIQEDSLDTTFNGTKFIFQDLLEALQKVIPDCQKEGQYMHPGPKCVEHSVNVIREEPAWTLNTDAHLRSALIGRSESIPIVQGKLELGEHGRIYFADFDGTHPRTRIVRVQVVGE
ncbi:MAG: YjbQ family protein [Chloroflexi bacterium]|nr:YjbQ family protein [Chloroflexota bacterium]